MQKQERKIIEDVPVVCYRNEKRTIMRTINVPTCDPCNPFVQQQCLQEVEVCVPYVATQRQERRITEDVPVVGYHIERRTIERRVHVDDSLSPINRTPPKCDWYPGKMLLDTTGAVVGGIGRGLECFGEGIKSKPRTPHGFNYGYGQPANNPNYQPQPTPADPRTNPNNGWRAGN
jgi:hypothetical protein